MLAWFVTAGWLLLAAAVGCAVVARHYGRKRGFGIQATRWRTYAIFAGAAGIAFAFVIPNFGDIAGFAKETFNLYARSPHR